MRFFNTNSPVLITVMVLNVLVVLITFALVLKLPTIRLKTKAAGIGVTVNAFLIVTYAVLKYLVL
ncbi:MAG: hypothetical protein ACMUHY_04630 [Thermoplasmatota archaeon]